MRRLARDHLDDYSARAVRKSSCGYLAAATAFRERVLGPTWVAYYQRLVDLQARGELNGEPDDVLDMAFGPLWYRLLTRPDQLDEEFASTVAAGIDPRLCTGVRGLSPRQRGIARKSSTGQVPFSARSHKYRSTAHRASFLATCVITREGRL